MDEKRLSPTIGECLNPSKGRGTSAFLLILLVGLPLLTWGLTSLNITGTGLLGERLTRITYAIDNNFYINEIGVENTTIDPLGIMFLNGKMDSAVKPFFTFLAQNNTALNTSSYLNMTMIGNTSTFMMGIEQLMFGNLSSSMGTNDSIRGLSKVIDTNMAVLPLIISVQYLWDYDYDTIKEYDDLTFIFDMNDVLLSDSLLTHEEYINMLIFFQENYVLNIEGIEIHGGLPWLKIGLTTGLGGISMPYLLPEI